MRANIKYAIREGSGQYHHKGGVLVAPRCKQTALRIASKLERPRALVTLKKNQDGVWYAADESRIF